MSTWIPTNQAMADPDDVLSPYEVHERRKALAHIRALIRDGKIVHGPDGTYALSPGYEEELYGGRACANPDCTTRFVPLRDTQKWCRPSCRNSFHGRLYRHRKANGIAPEPRSAICLKHNEVRQLVIVRGGAQAGKRYYRCLGCTRDATRRWRERQNAAA